MKIIIQSTYNSINYINQVYYKFIKCSNNSITRKVNKYYIKFVKFNEQNKLLSIYSILTYYIIYPLELGILPLLPTSSTCYTFVFTEQQSKKSTRVNVVKACIHCIFSCFRWENTVSFQRRLDALISEVNG